MASVVVIVSKTLQKYIIFVKSPNYLTKMMDFIYAFIKRNVNYESLYCNS